MRKEVLLALIIGGIIGGVILYGIKIANQAVSQNGIQLEDPNKPTSTLSNSLSPTPTSANIITLEGISNHSVIFTPQIKLTGKSTKPNTIITITSEEDEVLTTSDSNGNFSSDFKLVGGENNITINEILSDTLISTISIQVIHTTNPIE